MNSKSKNQVRQMLVNDDNYLYQVLNEYKGSFAVEYVLEALLAKGNTHTPESVLKLIRDNRDKK